jgi:hypothetical protein
VAIVKIRGTLKNDLIKLLVDFQEWKVTKSQDKVYSLLSLAADNPEVEPDYVQSMEETFVDPFSRGIKRLIGYVAIGLSTYREMNYSLPRFQTTYTATSSATVKMRSMMQFVCAERRVSTQMTRLSQSWANALITSNL